MTRRPRIYVAIDGEGRAHTIADPSRTSRYTAFLQFGDEDKAAVYADGWNDHRAEQRR